MTLEGIKNTAFCSSTRHPYDATEGPTRRRLHGIGVPERAGWILLSIGIIALGLDEFGIDLVYGPMRRAIHGSISCYELW